MFCAWLGFMVFTIKTETAKAVNKGRVRKLTMECIGGQFRNFSRLMGRDSLSKFLTEDLDGFGHFHKVREATLVAGGFDQMVIDPMVVAASGFVHKQSVVLEAPALEPGFGDFPQILGSTRKKGDDMPFVVPSVAGFQGIGVMSAVFHALRLLVGNVFANGSIDVDQVIFDPFWEYRTGQSAIFILSFVEYFFHQLGVSAIEILWSIGYGVSPRI